MSDLREDYDAMKEHQRQEKGVRRAENLAYLQVNCISWVWVDKLSDHILIAGEIDYYLGKTYWSHRKTKKHGYAMLNKLIGSSSNTKVQSP